MAKRICPFCKEKVKENATICKHCGSKLPALPPKKWYQTWKGLLLVLFLLGIIAQTFKEQPTSPPSQSSSAPPPSVISEKKTAKKNNSDINDDLNNNLSKSKCIHSWKYNKSTFKLYLNTALCKENETSAALLAIRYIFESNKSKFPKRIEIYTNYGKQLASYPFENIPSLVKGYLPDTYETISGSD
ncbi:MAG: hypothetical protein C4B57_11865 [Deltaproteobacteria bacterium]|nr:MAG: hypothetical protein C4B57_11865 [Deltaproteobacteria bacterium]